MVIHLVMNCPGCPGQFEFIDRTLHFGSLFPRGLLLGDFVDCGVFPGPLWGSVIGGRIDIFSGGGFTFILAGGFIIRFLGEEHPVDKMDQSIIGLDIGCKDADAVHPDNPVRTAPPPEPYPAGRELQFGSEQCCCRTLRKDVARGKVPR